MLTRKMTLPLAALAFALTAHSLPLAKQDGPTVRTEALDGTVAEISVDGLAVERMGASAARIDFVGRSASGEALLWSDASFELLLQSGDHVRGEIASGSEESLSLEIVGGARAEFAIEEIASLFAIANKQDQSVLTAPKSGDRLWRITPGGFDPLDGFLIGFDAMGVTVEGELGARLTPWDEIACLWIEALEEVTKDARTEDAEGRAPVAVDLLDGSRLRGHFGGIADGQLRLERTGHAALVLSLTSVAHVALDDERQSFLSDRAWKQVGNLSLFGDEFGMRWPALSDRAVSGESLRAGGRSWSRGLGVHAPSHLKFEGLSGGFLRGSVAIDDSVLGIPAKGSAIFHVVLDGKRAWSSPELTSGDAPVPLPAIAIGDAKTLELKVDVASDSFMGDRANWLEVRIVKP